ncbi:UNVERIFIED_CONTAM: hypothetical protein HDU68_007263 [Siphonaria sp. JEL0065]|nr:hypothetical protein HDU68_007263 [Siphonaria sp. JEL0065]
MELQTTMKTISHDLYMQQQAASTIQQQYDQLEFECKQIIEERDHLVQEVQYYEVLIHDQQQQKQKQREEQQGSRKFEDEEEREKRNEVGNPSVVNAACSPFATPMKTKRESLYLGLVQGNSLASEMEDTSLVSENAALREEIVGLTQYINKLICQINAAGLEQEEPLSPQHHHSDATIIPTTVKRWALGGLRKFSGGNGDVDANHAVVVPVLEPIVLDHKEWLAKEAATAKSQAHEFGGVGFQNVALDSRRDDEKQQQQLKRTTVLGTLSKTLGSWYSSNHGKIQQDDENVPLGIVHRNSPDLIIRMKETSDISVAPPPQFPEIQKMERAHPKIGFRQSRITENKRAVQY